LINYSDKFENEIGKFYESNDNFLSDIDQFYSYLAELHVTVIDPNKFIKIMKILKLVVSSEKYVNLLISWLQYNEEPGRIIDEVVYEINFEKILLKQKYKFLDYCVRNTTNRNDIGNLYDHIIGKLQEEDYCVMDENDSKFTSTYKEKLKQMVETASCSDKSIKIKFSENSTEKAPILEITGPDESCWKSMILSIPGVTSFKVTYFDNRGDGVMSGYTEHSNIKSKNWTFPGQEDWYHSIASYCYNGKIYGTEDASSANYGLCDWRTKNDYIIIKNLPETINFEVNGNAKKSNCSIKKSKYNVNYECEE